MLGASAALPRVAPEEELGVALGAIAEVLDDAVPEGCEGNILNLGRG